MTKRPRPNRRLSDLLGESVIVEYSTRAIVGACAACCLSLCPASLGECYYPHLCLRSHIALT